MGGYFRNEGVIVGRLSVTSVLQALRDLQHGSQRGNRNSDRGKQIDRRENIDSDKSVDHGALLSGVAAVSGHGGRGNALGVPRSNQHRCSGPVGWGLVAAWWPWMVKGRGLPRCV